MYQDFIDEMLAFASRNNLRLSINYPLSADVECTMEGDIDGPLFQKLTGIPTNLIDNFTVQFSEPYQEQVRRHKKKRINKKWAKRYGYRTKTRIRTIENVRIKPTYEEPGLDGLSEFEFIWKGD